MAERGTVEYRNVELVVHLGAMQHVASVFAVRHNDGRETRRLLARHIEAGAGPCLSTEDLIDTLEAAITNLRAGMFTPPR